MCVYSAFSYLLYCKNMYHGQLLYYAVILKKFYVYVTKKYLFWTQYLIYIYNVLSIIERDLSHILFVYVMLSRFIMFMLYLYIAVVILIMSRCYDIFSWFMLM